MRCARVRRARERASRKPRPAPQRARLEDMTPKQKREMWKQLQTEFFGEEFGGDNGSDDG